jgi:hypothetical protein
MDNKSTIPAANLLHEAGSSSVRDGSRAKPLDEASSRNVATDEADQPQSLIAPTSTGMIETPDAAALLLPVVLDRVQDFTDSMLCRIFESHGLSQDQAIFTYLHKLMRYSQRQIAGLVGWSEKHAQSVRRSLDRPPARRAMAASGLAASAARWPGTQRGRVIAIFFIECPQIAETALTVEVEDARLTRARRSRSHHFMFKPVVITPAQVEAEFERVTGPELKLWGHSIEWVRLQCGDRLRKRASDAAEFAELTRIEGLSSGDAIAELEAARMAFTITRESRDRLVAEKKAAVAEWQSKGLQDGVRATAAYISSPLPGIQTALAQAIIDHTSAARSLQALSEAVLHNSNLADAKHRAESLAKYRPKIEKLAVEVEHSAPELAQRLLKVAG